MTARILLATAVVLTSVTSLQAARSSSIPASLPETRALDSQLAGLSRETRAAAAMLQQMRRDVKSARGDVDRARSVVSAIRSMDGRLGRLFQRLSVFTSVPKVRTPVRLLISNLKRVQKAVHGVRRKSDRFDKQVLSPLRSKLVKFERSLYGAYSKLAGMAKSADDARSKLARSASLAQRNSNTRRLLERASREVRPSAARVRQTVAEVNSNAGSVRHKLSSFRTGLASFWTVQSSLSSLSKKMQPAEKFAGDLNRVLSKRLSIRLPIPPFKRVGFTIKEVLEKPGKILNKVLKPLEKLADKALQPILKKTKLEIRTPRGLTELSRAMDRLTATSNSLTASITQFETFVRNDLNRQADQFTALLKQRLASIR